jgi:hypothetical protein
MAKEPKAIYAPGELDKVRQNLGDIDKDEAKKMAARLGGEVGWERSHAEEEARQKPKSRNEVVDVHIKGSPSNYSRNQPKHRIELAADGEENSIKKNAKRIILDPSDNPANPFKISYKERIKMDRFAAQPEFEIKNASQVFHSVLSIFAEVPDYVNPEFINRRMKDIYQKIETLVTSIRSLFPRNNVARNDKIKKTSEFAFSVLDTLRYWNIEKISAEFAKIQSHLRNTKISDFSDILKAIYKPLFILEKLDPEKHIKESFKLLYKELALENAAPESKQKTQEMIRNALSAYVVIRRDVGYVLYPMLMKLLSDRWMTYDNFFKNRKNRFMHFINVSEEDQIAPILEEELLRKIPDEESSSEEQSEDEEARLQKEKESLRKKAAEESEAKALGRGQSILESLFPKAGWERMDSFPDLYPYFHHVFGFPKGYELISPADPVQQIIILMRIIKEISFGIRYISFGTVSGADGSVERIDEVIGKIVNEWHGYIENTFEKLYIPRLIEYCRILDSPGYKASAYSRRILNELHLLKKFCFLPHYTFSSLAPPTIQRKDVKAIFSEVRTLRRYLTLAARSIEQANTKGGADKQASCDGVDNPWEVYKFPVRNPVSTRIDALMEGKNSTQRNNAALIFFLLSITVVLDYLMNNESSWAYKEQTGSLFRSVNGEGEIPLMGVDTVIDSDLIFQQSLRLRERRG